MRWPTHTPADVRLPQVLKRWHSSLQAGNGSSLPHSHSMSDGDRPVLKPIVLSISAGDGLNRFLTALATIYALKEEASGEHMVTLCWGMERAALRSLIETSQSDGSSDEIKFELSIAAEGPAITSQNTFSKRPMYGIQGVLCDRCEVAFTGNESYTTICSPAVQQMRLYHSACVSVIPKP